MTKYLTAILAGLTLSLLVATAHAGEKKRPDNTPPEGYELLFNGKDLTGWQGFVAPLPKLRAMSEAQRAEAQKKATERMREHWQVKDGVIVFDGDGKSLVTAKDYGDFELYVDWKIHKNGDSGVYLRGTPQVQIWDPNQHKLGSGGLYNNKKHPSKPLVTADNPIGEWNTFWIKMVGDKVTVKLNGKLVVDNTVLENFWDRDQPLYATGPIELQNHGNPLYFKNIYVKELPRKE